MSKDSVEDQKTLSLKTGSAMREGDPTGSAAVPLSICVPTYNGEEYIREALASILAQTYDAFEVVVVDDASTDRTVDIVRTFSDPRVRVYQNTERRGIPGNWNESVRLARGEYVCVFHQDDVMLPDNLACKMQLVAGDRSISFVHSQAQAIREAGAPSPLGNWIEAAEADFVAPGISYFRKLIFQGDCICAPTVIARRELLLAAGGFNEALGYACDYEMWMKLCLEGKVGFVQAALVRYRWHGQNASHGYQYERGVTECAAAMRAAVQYFEEQAHPTVETVWLREAVEALVEQRQWAATLDRGRAWLEDQWQRWQAVAREQEQMLEEFRHSVMQLEQGKQWLEDQWQRWQQIATEQECRLQDQHTYFQEVESGKQWLEDQWQRWQQIAEERQALLHEQQDRYEAQKDKYEAQRDKYEAQRAALIQHHNECLRELEQAKQWLEDQWQLWRDTAEQRAEAMADLKNWITQLEDGKRWLEDQRTYWQAQTESCQTVLKQWQKSRWGRIGLRLGLIKLPPSRGGEQD